MAECEGRDAVSRSWLMPGGPPPRLRYVQTSANAQPALGTYLLQPGRRRYIPIALDVITFGEPLIASVAAFRDPSMFARATTTCAHRRSAPAARTYKAGGSGRGACVARKRHAPRAALDLLAPERAPGRARGGGGRRARRARRRGRPAARDVIRLGTGEG